MTHEDYKKEMGKIPKDKILGTETVNGEEFIRTTFRVLVETFPNKWILMSDTAPVYDGGFFLCTVLSVCDDVTVYAEFTKLMNAGYNVEQMRASTAIWG